METLWFVIVSLVLAVYVVLDGFDFGAGALHLFVARTDRERRQVLAAIGPFWDGNEVWLLAGGGVLFLAFPRVLATGLSGFYLAIMLLLWVLILRGISIEFRSHVEDPMWRIFWDTAFCAASTLAPVLLGAALANVLRGVPLDARWLVCAVAVRVVFAVGRAGYSGLVHRARRRAGAGGDRAPRRAVSCLEDRRRGAPAQPRRGRACCSRRSSSLWVAATVATVIVVAGRVPRMGRTSARVAVHRRCFLADSC